jgi:hypothetical protein
MKHDKPEPEKKAEPKPKKKPLRRYPLSGKRYMSDEQFKQWRATEPPSK